MMQSKPRYRIAARSRPLPHSEAAGLLSGGTSAPYRAADPFDQALAGWTGSRGSADRDWQHGRLTAIARIRDSVRNDPLAASIRRRKKNVLVGWGWLFKPMPDARALGLDPNTEAGAAALDRLAASQKAAWRKWAEDPLFRCDWEGELDFDLMLALATTHKIVDGEGLAQVCYRDPADRIGNFAFGTCLQIIDPDRLAAPDGEPDSDTMRAGVRLDGDGRVLSYTFRDGHPFDVGMSAAAAFNFTEVPAREPWGRPRVIHLYDRQRAGQHRGVSDLVSSLRRLKTLEAYTDAELRSKVINAMVVASFTSDMGGDYLAEIFGERGGSDLVATRQAFYEQANISVAGSKVLQPFPGDKLDWNTQGRVTDDYADFAHALSSQITGGAGLTAEMITGDFTRHNYSSGRMSLAEAWRDVETERDLIATKFAGPVALAVMEEAFYGGLLDLPPGAPDFWDEPGAYVRCDWIGPPRGYVDPVKEPQGAALRVANLSSSAEQIAMEDGNDPDDVIEDNRRWARKLAAAGQSPAQLTEILGATGPTDTPEERAVRRG